MKEISKAALCFGIIFSVTLIPCRAATKTSDSLLDRIPAGEQVFNGQCAVCHSTKPDQRLVGPSLYGETSGSHPRKTDTQVRKIVLNGQGRMPDFKGVLSTRDLDNLLAYIRTQSAPEGK